MNAVRFTIAAMVALSASAAIALDSVDFRRDGEEYHVSGKLVAKADDGKLMLLAPDGVLWPILPDEVIKERHDDARFQPLDSQQLAKRLVVELPGFQTYTSPHYLICYNTSKQYATWCAGLFERLHGAFMTYWSRKGIDLHEPEFPLVAIIFSDREAYLKYAEQELGEAAGSVIGYYSLRTNRVAMYDLTGVDSLRKAAGRRGSTGDINRMLAQPEAETMVATVVHEATHQIAFNSGLQTRFVDIPLWVSEGIAVYFETPDLQSSKGWRTVGAVNRSRLDIFRSNLLRRPPSALKAITADDKQFRDPRIALSAYAEAWALNYYLLKHRPKEYVAYLKMLSAKKPLATDTPATRLKEFEAAFGENLDRDFLRQLQKVR